MDPALRGKEKHELGDAQRNEKTAGHAPGIIPGDRGMDGGAGPPIPCWPRGRYGNFHQFLWTGSHPSRNANMELCGEARNSETAIEPSQVCREFRPGRLTQWPRGVQVTTVSQHGHAGRARPPRQKASAAKRSAKAAGVFGERANVAKFAKPPDWGGWKNRSTQLQYQGNLRGKRSDPSRGVNAPRPSVAALAKNGGDAIAPDCRRVSTMSGELSSADGGRTGLRGLTQ
jgi:hypothetical protein